MYDVECKAVAAIQTICIAMVHVLFFQLYISVIGHRWGTVYVVSGDAKVLVHSGKRKVLVTENHFISIWVLYVHMMDTVTVLMYLGGTFHHFEVWWAKHEYLHPRRLMWRLVLWIQLLFYSSYCPIIPHLIVPTLTLTRYLTVERMWRIWGFNLWFR